MGFNFIDPVDGMIGRLLHGPMHRFTYQTKCGFHLGHIESLMRQYGIRVWGRQLEDENETAFLVKKGQAIWAEYILCRAGVPLTCRLLEPRNGFYRERHSNGSMPLPWHKEGIRPKTLVDLVDDWLYRMLG